MDNSLATRVKSCMADIGINNEQLAIACGVKAPTSFHWASGKTKKIKAEPLLAAARLFGVTPEWLSTGRLPKYAASASVEVREPTRVQAFPVPAQDPMTAELLALFHLLDKSGKAECLAYVRGFVKGRSPHAHGPASAVAG